MPPLPVIEDTFRVVLNWSHPSQTNAVNVLHFQRDAATAEDVWNGLDEHVTSAMWGLQDTDAVVTDVDITPLDGTTATSTFSTGSVAKWRGQSAGDGLAGTAIVVSLRTAFRGPSHRGRIYLPFPNAAAMTENRFGGTAIGTLTTAWTTFLAAMVTEAESLVVASYKLGTASLVTNLSIDDVPGIQRRRNTRVRNED